jgi:hypothetical protein
MAVRIIGPIQGAAATLALGSQSTLGAMDYVEEEYWLEGTSVRYELVGERGSDGRWGAKPTETAPYRTRMLVRRPRDPGEFRGTAVVEWLNVSVGADGAPDWASLHRQIVRSGMAWVGISAQRAGVLGGGLMEGAPLISVDPARYGSLEHPGDDYSYDIYNQGAAALRSPEGAAVLGGRAPDCLLSVGSSQSAAALLTYINAVHPLTKVFDGYLLHARGTIGFPLTDFVLPVSAATDLKGLQEILGSLPADRVRTDLGVPVMALQSEGDAIALVGWLARQDDSEHYRLWEITGAAHGDLYAGGAAVSDDGTLSHQQLVDLLQQPPDFGGIAVEKFNSSPHQHYVGHASLVALDRWVRDGTPPPCAPRIEISPEGLPVTDEFGIARGGVRTPWVDVPVATHSGAPWSLDIDFLEALPGFTEPFDAEQLAKLYPGGKPDYLARARVSLDDAIAAGFLLADDRAEMEALLEAAYLL